MKTREKRNEPRVVKIEEPPRGLKKNFRKVFCVTVGGGENYEREIRVYRKRHNDDVPGYITVKPIHTMRLRPETEVYWVSPIMLDIMEGIHAQANGDIIGLVRKHFGGMTPAPPRKLVTGGPDGERLEAVKCMDCTTEYWSNGSTPCPRCAVNPSMISEEVPSFEDFIASGGRIEYEPPVGVRVNAPPYDETGKPEEDISDVAKRLDVSCLSDYDADAITPEAPATQDDISSLAKALSREVKRIENAFKRIIEKKGLTK